MILLAHVLEEVKEKGDIQFLNYLVSLIHFLPSSALLLFYIFLIIMFIKKWEGKESVAEATIYLSPNVFCPLSLEE